jgi:hypothetical protein
MKNTKGWLRHIAVILGLCIVAVVGGSTKLAAQDGCAPATCPNGTHSVCHKECDPNVSPICSPRCVCRCEPIPGGDSFNRTDAVVRAPGQDDCETKGPLVNELLDTRLWNLRN